MPAVVLAQQPSAAQVRFFETNIRPALVKYCYECHSVEAGDSQGGLLVDTRNGLMQGGDAGPAIVPGNSEASLLWEAITWQGYEMPPSQKMPVPVIANFKKWIDMGAPDPRVREITNFTTKITKKDIETARREHWAFQKPRSGGFQPPLKRSSSFQPPVKSSSSLQQPSAKDTSTGRKNANATSTIDRIVAERLVEEGLNPNERADGYTLLRRIYFDLAGLPPTPAEINRFQAAYRANPEAALKSKIDQLLATPQYGERWGRHWLDVARYGESSGSRNTPFPHAWRYRDYVIDSFNDDTPYDRFIAEQIAGDLLPVKTDEQWTENIVATGFLAIGLKHLDEKNPREFMSSMVDEQIDTTTQAFLGLTVACARCHDHKYDPIPTDDYYSLAGIFYSTKTYYGTERIAQNHRPSDLLLLPVQDESVGGSQNRQRMETIKRQIADLDRQSQQAANGKDRRGIRNNRNRIAAQLASMNPDGSVKSFAMGVQDRDQMINANILFGGEIEKPAQEVPRGFVQILGNLNFNADGNKSGRLELAKAMTSKNNPLTARVMVNRIWMHLIGKPLVETPSNFGLGGMPPSNQKLLDHLAVRFMQHDWGIKDMIREIMMTETYLRSSKYDESNYAVDPDNKFSWRGNPRHMDAESLRDSMLSVASQLSMEPPSRSLAIGTRGRDRGVNQVDTYRSVYLPIDRALVPPALDLFGFPDPNVTSASRAESIVPTQALYMMNDDFVVSQAQAMARTIEQRFDRREDQIRMAVLWAFGRPATSDELQASRRFFEEFNFSGSQSLVANRTNGNGANEGGRRARGGRRNGPMGAGTQGAAANSQFTVREVQFYEQKVQPILANNCLSCHGAGRVRGGLQLTSHSSLVRGGNSGSVINKRSLDDSMLLQVVQSGSMPPRGKLSNPEIEVLRQWIRMNAPFPSQATTNVAANGPMGRAGGRGPAGRGGRGQGGPPGLSEPTLSPPSPLSVFCQTLMASASFRVLD
ncbi:MAG: DUF1549 domain-containing protein [Planctomycetota bacterium]